MLFKKKKHQLEEELEIIEETTNEIQEEVIEAKEERMMEESLVDAEESIVEEDLKAVEAEDDIEYKKDINEYFEENKEEKLKELKIEEIQPKEKKKSKRQKKKEAIYQNVVERKVFVFHKKTYKKVEDLIQYLNGHYLDLEEIANEILKDENFYGWLSKQSGVFDDSIKEFKTIKEKIEKK